MRIRISADGCVALAHAVVATALVWCALTASDRLPVWYAPAAWTAAAANLWAAQRHLRRTDAVARLDEAQARLRCVLAGFDPDDVFSFSAISPYDGEHDEYPAWQSWSFLRRPE